MAQVDIDLKIDVQGFDNVAKRLQAALEAGAVSPVFEEKWSGDTLVVRLVAIRVEL